MLPHEELREQAVWSLLLEGPRAFLGDRTDPHSSFVLLAQTGRLFTRGAVEHGQQVMSAPWVGRGWKGRSRLCSTAAFPALSKTLGARLVSREHGSEWVGANNDCSTLEAEAGGLQTGGQSRLHR